MSDDLIKRLRRQADAQRGLFAIADAALTDKAADALEAAATEAQRLRELEGSDNLIRMDFGPREGWSVFIISPDAHILGIGRGMELTEAITKAQRLDYPKLSNQQEGTK